MSKPVKLSAVIITLNEEKKLEDCLRFLSFVDEIVIVDSHSSDRTPEIAERYHARFIQRPFDNFSAQKNFSIEQAKGDWILSIDADERVTKALQSEILEVMDQPSSADGYWIPRENFVFGGRMRFGPAFGDRQLRLFRKGKGKFEGLVHERILLNGSEGVLRHPLHHYTYQTLREYYLRFDKYTTLEAQTLYKKGLRPTLWHIALRPFLEFFYFYIFRLGFLDGRVGFQNQVHASFYTYVKFAKALDLFNGVEKMTSLDPPPVELTHR